MHSSQNFGAFEIASTGNLEMQSKATLEGACRFVERISGVVVGSGVGVVEGGLDGLEIEESFSSAFDDAIRG
jgi:hypothetical protein